MVIFTHYSLTDSIETAMNYLVFVAGVQLFSKTLWLKPKWQHNDIASSLVFILLLAIDFRYLSFFVILSFFEALIRLNAAKDWMDVLELKYKAQTIALQGSPSIVLFLRHYGFAVPTLILYDMYGITLFQIKLIWMAIRINWNWMKIGLTILLGLLTFSRHIKNSSISPLTPPNDIIFGMDKFIYVLLPHLFALRYIVRSYQQWRCMQSVSGRSFFKRMKGIAEPKSEFAEEEFVAFEPGLFSQLVLSPAFYTRVFIAHHQALNDFLA